MGKKIKGPVDMIDGGSSGQQGINPEEIFMIESDRLSAMIDLSQEPSIDDLPTPVNIQGVYDQTVLEANQKSTETIENADAYAAQTKADAESNAEEIIRSAEAEAEQRAEAIRKDAERDSIAISESARQNGFVEGRENGIKEGYDEGSEMGSREGWERGYREGWDQGHKEYEDVIYQVRHLLTSIHKTRQDFIAQMESDIIGLIFDISEKIVHHQIANDHVIYHTVKSMLEYTARHERIAVHVHPDEIQKLQPHHQEFVDLLDQIAEISLIEDDTVESGGCVLNTNLGSVDAQIETQLQHVKELLNLSNGNSN